MRRVAAFALAAIALLPLAELAAKPPTALEGQETSIPFPETGIRSWDADDDYSLWVLDDRGRWYRVELMSPCVGLPYGDALRFETMGTGRFDRTSSITYRGQRCPVKSVVRAVAPKKTS